jgi:transcriptional regulator with XRE-family HTH domain
MTRLSGANRSTIYRWMSGGDGQPDYDLVNRLAAAIWRREPRLARELVEASGYAWAEPTEIPQPTISPALLAAIRKELPDPEDQQRVIETIERRLRGEPPPSASAQSTEGESDGRRAVG